MRAAAFTTRTKPAWCLECIGMLFRQAGVQAIEPMAEPQGWWLTRCLACDVQAHYRLDYAQGKGGPICRVCASSGPARWRVGPTREEVVSRLGEQGYKLVGPVKGGFDPVVAQCRRCVKISVVRMSELRFGCVCSRNTRSSHPTVAKPESRLLIDSDSPALRWWDRERNEDAILQTVSLRARRECHWLCPECGLSFQAPVARMVIRAECPECSARRSAEWRVEHERLTTTPVSAVPSLLAAWADTTDPHTIMVAGGAPLSRFRCPQGHHPRIRPLTYLQSGCPHCRAAVKEKQWLAEVLPEIAAQWHATRNGGLTAKAVVWDSKRVVWWHADCCGHEWQEAIRDRDKYQRWRCPRCRTVLDSVAWQDPGLAGEWSANNALTAWQVRPHSTTAVHPEWICATDPSHVWHAPVSSRSNGAECPQCRKYGKSRVELDHWEAAKAVFGEAISGQVVRDRAFTTRGVWTVDIVVTVGGRTVVVEYDGAYWHRAPAKMMTDERKSKDLLAAGYVLVRLREDDLPALPIVDQNYFEIRVRSQSPRPQAVMAEIRYLIPTTV